MRVYIAFQQSSVHISVYETRKPQRETKKIRSVFIFFKNLVLRQDSCEDCETDKLLERGPVNIVSKQQNGIFDFQVEAVWS